MNNGMFYHDIKSFKEINRLVTEKARFVCLTESGEPIFDDSILLPSLSFHVSPKLHGCNAGVVFNSETGEIKAISRNRVLSIESDNYGFAFYVKSNENIFKKLFESIEYDLNLVNNLTEIILYGEWAGPGIQKGVAISSIENKSFFIFDCKISEVSINNESKNYFVVKHYLTRNNFDIIPQHTYFIQDYAFDDIIIDFNNPDEAISRIEKLVEEVEHECPVAKTFNKPGTGEGLVICSYYKDTRIIWKAKGEKHKVTKTKKLIPLDIEKINSINEYVDFVCTENRMNQMLTNLKETSGTVDIKLTGDFIKLVIADILKEELETLVKSNLEFDNVKAEISNRARKYFLKSC